MPTNVPSVDLLKEHEGNVNRSFLQHAYNQIDSGMTAKEIVDGLPLDSALVQGLKEMKVEDCRYDDQRVALEEVKARLSGERLVAITRNRLVSLISAEAREKQFELDRSHLYAAMPYWMGFTSMTSEQFIPMLVAWLNGHHWGNDKSLEDSWRGAMEMSNKFEARVIELEQSIREHVCDGTDRLQFTGNDATGRDRRADPEAIRGQPQSLYQDVFDAQASMGG